MGDWSAMVDRPLSLGGPTLAVSQFKLDRVVSLVKDPFEIFD